MYCIKNFLFILIVLSSSCARVEINNRREVSSLNNCAQTLKKILPTLHRAKGMEFEGAIPSFLDYEYIANFISKRVKALYPDSKPKIIESEIDGVPIFKIQFNHEGHSYTYTVEDDASLAFGLDDKVKSIEISSPILRSYHDIEKHLSIIEDLQKVGLRARPDEGAIHIHHDLEDDFSFEDLYFIYSSFSKMQKSFREVFNYNDRRGFNKGEHLDYIAKNLRRLIDSGDDLEVSTEVIELVDNKGYIRASHAYGTLEFRFFNSTASKDEQLLFVDFINKFMKERNNPELVELFNKNKEVSIYDISELISADLHRQNHLLKAIRERNEYYEDLAAIQEGRNPFLSLRKDQPVTTNAQSLIQYISESKNDLELSNYLAEHLQVIQVSSYEDWIQIINEIKPREFSLIAALKHLSYETFTSKEIFELTKAILRQAHGSIYSKTFELLKNKLVPDELYEAIENLFIPELKKMTAEQDYSLSFLVDGVFKSNLEDQHTNNILSLLQKNFRIGELTKLQIRRQKLFSAMPLHFNSLKSMLSKSKDYNSFAFAPTFRKILEKSSLDPSYMDQLFDGIYSNLNKDEQIKFIYFFIDFLKTDNLEEITSLIPFFEKSFIHLKSFDKLQDMVTILSRQHKEIFQGPRRNKRLLNNIYRKLVSLPKASRKKSLLQQVIRLTSRVNHIDYEYYLDIIIKEMKDVSSQDLTSDFIHLVTSAHKMNALTDDKLDIYLNFIWSEIDNIQLYQLHSFQVKALLDNLHELNNNVIKRLMTWSARRSHYKTFKIVRDRLEKI